MLKRLVKLYFKNEISRAKDKLYELRNKKKKILDEVMDKETYKVAKEILEKFAPDQLRGNSPNKTTQPTSGDPKLNNDPNREKSASPQAIPRPNLPTPPGISRPMVQQTEIPRPFPMGPQFPQQPPQQQSQSEDEDAQQFNAGDSVIAPDLGGINSNKSLSPITLGGNDIVHSSPDTIRETSNDSKSSTESPKDSEAVESKKEK
ncbi:hypothetical protein AAG570_010561 [Ranatra chinensis]|uniref:Uncharacterized protein n=1 Tax=Ranatra chinensis TaxID=642074 RepID=A0ABD0YMX5_9HEMI